jgi:AraC-like DNA-binding protein
MKVYTDIEYQQEYQASLEYEQIETNIRGFNEISANKSQWGQTQYSYLSLSSGIELDLVDEQIYLNYNNLVKHDNRQYLTAKFYLQGNHSVICPDIPGVSPQYQETGGQNYLFYLPNIEEIEQYWAGDRLQLLRIEIDLDAIRRFVTELDYIPQALCPLIKANNPARFHCTVGQVTPQMATIAQQIWHHPYHGAIAKMYLEGKVWELFALQLAQLAESELSPVKSSLKPQSIDRIYQAKDILLQKLENPPSISELTQQVGICELTLRRGFRELFQTTIIQYLTQKRMEQAELLLREKKLSVAEVSNLVGYSHLGYFAKVFKRQFGITPSECLAGKLGTWGLKEV